MHILIYILKFLNTYCHIYLREIKVNPCIFLKPFKKKKTLDFFLSLLVGIPQRDMPVHEHSLFSS